MKKVMNDVGQNYFAALQCCYYCKGVQVFSVGLYFCQKKEKKKLNKGENHF
jgi:hypothetical protein